MKNLSVNSDLFGPASGTYAEDILEYSNKFLKEYLETTSKKPKPEKVFKKTSANLNVSSSEKTKYKAWKKSKEEPVNINLAFDFFKQTKITDNIKKCFNEKRTLFLDGDIQQGKTEAKFELAIFAYEQRLADIIIILTMNLGNARKQLFDRGSGNNSNGNPIVGPFYKRCAKTPVIIDHTFNKDQLLDKPFYIGIQNATSVRKLIDAIKITNTANISCGFTDKKYLFIFDEAEMNEYQGGSEDNEYKNNITESELFKLITTELIEEGYDTNIAKVSGTLAPAIYTSAYFSQQPQAELRSYQLIKLPKPIDYVGYEELNYAKTELLLEEDYTKNILSKNQKLFTNGSWNSKIFKYKDIKRYNKNFNNLCMYLHNKIVTNTLNDRKAPEMWVLNYGTSTISHEWNATLCSEILRDDYGYNTSIWDANDELDESIVNNNADVVCITYNSGADSLSKVLSSAANFFSQVKLIILCGQKMLDRSVSVNAENCHVIESPEWGWWCNGVIVYGTKSKSAVSLKQILRNCGNRPFGVKQAELITTPDYINLLDSFTLDQNANFAKIQHQGIISRGELLEWTLKAHQNLFKNSINKILNFTSPGTPIDNIVREDFVSKGIATPVDYLIEVSKLDYDAIYKLHQDSLYKDKTVRDAWLRKFAETYCNVNVKTFPELYGEFGNGLFESTGLLDTRLGIDLNYGNNRTTESGLRARIQGGGEKNDKKDWQFTLTEYDGKYFVYFYNHLVPNVASVYYSVSLDPKTSFPRFNNSRLRNVSKKIIYS